MKSQFNIFHVWLCCKIKHTITQIITEIIENNMYSLNKIHEGIELG